MKLRAIGLLLLLTVGSINQETRAQLSTKTSLVIPELPMGWSKQTDRNSIVYSNYNLQPGQLETLTLFEPFESDTLLKDPFATIWNRLSLKQPMPPARFRRLYTNQGMLFYFGGSELEISNVKQYYQLIVYPVSPKKFEYLLLNCSSLSYFKTIQNDWLERFQNIILKK